VLDSRFLSRAPAALLLAAVPALGAGSAFAAEWRVEQDGSADFTVIQDAIDAASDGDTVTVGPGGYSESLLVDAKWIVLRSRTGADDTVISNGYAARAIEVRRSGNPLVVMDLGFVQNRAGGLEFPGGAGGTIVTLAAPLAVHRCRFEQSLATGVGGAIYCRTGYVPGVGNPRPADDPSAVRLLVEDCTFVGNFAGDEGGALFADEAPVAVTGTRFEDNDAVGGGAVAVLDAPLFVSGSEFLDNSVAVFGGAISFTGLGAVTLLDSAFRENRSEGLGGAVRIHQALSAFVSGCVFTDNEASNNGGALHVEFAPLMLETTLFAGGVANRGGGLYVRNGEATVMRCSFVDNSASAGSSLEIEQTEAEVTASVFADAASNATSCRVGTTISSGCNAGIDGAGGCVGIGARIEVERCPADPDVFCRTFEEEDCGELGHTTEPCPSQDECITSVETATWGGLKILYRD